MIRVRRVYTVSILERSQSTVSVRDIIDHLSVITPHLDFKEISETMSLGADIVRHVKIVQRDDPEIACFLHASRAGKVIIYYKSSPFSTTALPKEHKVVQKHSQPSISVSKANIIFKNT